MIEVGDWIRTDKGYIAQIKEFKKNYTVGKRINKKEEVNENYINLGENQCKFVESIDYSIPSCYPTDEELERIKKHIVKHSKNLIDLIEVRRLCKWRNCYRCRRIWFVFGLSRRR